MKKRRKDISEIDTFVPKRESDIILTLDHYDDIFSDFDPRSFSERALSVDFLDEAKRAMKDKHGSVFINFMLPKKLRDKESEEIIKKRLKEHSGKHHHLLASEKKKILQQGSLYTFAGIFFMSLTSFILYKHADNSMLATFLIVLLEPGSWFLFWEGLNMLVFERKKDAQDIRFYRKMMESAINFVNRN